MRIIACIEDPDGTTLNHPDRAICGATFRVSLDPGPAFGSEAFGATK